MLDACRLMDVAEECIESNIEDFRLTVTDIVDQLEVRRKMSNKHAVLLTAMRCS